MRSFDTTNVRMTAIGWFFGTYDFEFGIYIMTMLHSQKLYYTLLTFAVGFWALMAANHALSVASAENGPASPSGDFAVCGIEVSDANESYDPDTGTYTIDFSVHNPTDQPQSIIAKEFSCRCAEPNGQDSGDLGFPFDWDVCVGEWPAPLGNPGDLTDVEANCGFTEETVVLDPGETVQRTVTVPTHGEVFDPNCGSFQADWFVRQVTNGDGVVCKADDDPGVPSHQGTPIPGAFGVWFTGRDSNGEVCREGEPEPPVCDIEITPDPASGDAPLNVTFDGRGSTDADGTIEDYTWELSTGFSTDEPVFDYEFTIPGSYAATLVVTDNDELSSAICRVPIEVTEPTPDEYICDTVQQTCELEENVPVNRRGDACAGLHNDEVCLPPPDEYVCNTRSQSCELEENVPQGARGISCAGLNDDIVCEPEEVYVCDTRTESCQLLDNVPVNERGVSCDGLRDDAVCEEPEERYVCDTRTESCQLLENVPANDRGVSCRSLQDDLVCERPREEYVCDTRSQTCELETNVPVQYRNGACADLHDDVSCDEEEGPQFSQEPWVLHAGSQARIYRKAINVVHGGPVNHWETNDIYRVVSDSSSHITIDARSGQCPDFSALVGGVLYGPFEMGCAP